MTPFAKTFAGALFLLLPLVALANPGGNRPPGPPPEAVEACESLEVDDECSFEHRGEQLNGTCTEGPRSDLPLACLPEGHQGPPPRDAE
jgi:hypothetical protein